MEPTTFRARIMNYNPLAYKATMYFECQTDFGRWVKFSCITMALFIVMYIHFSCNINKWLSLNTISLNIFDRVPVAKAGFLMAWLFFLEPVYSLSTRFNYKLCCMFQLSPRHIQQQLLYTVSQIFIYPYTKKSYQILRTFKTLFVFNVYTICHGPCEQKLRIVIVQIFKF